MNNRSLSTLRDMPKMPRIEVDTVRAPHANGYVVLGDIVIRSDDGSIVAHCVSESAALAAFRLLTA